MDATGGAGGAGGGWVRRGGNPAAGSPTVPGLRMLRRLGAGSRGEVWLAQEEPGGDRVAVRVRGIAARGSADGPADGPAQARLARRAALLRRLEDPHVVRVRRLVDCLDGDRALVMDHAVGGSLADLVDVRGPLTAGEAATVVMPLARTMAALHRRGLVHGRLGPGDVLFTVDGRPMIADLGCGVLLGEASAEAEAQGSDDVRALGAVLRFALTGRTEPGDLPPVPDAARDRLLGLADLCTRPDPDRRPAPDDVARTVADMVRPLPVRLLGARAGAAGGASGLEPGGGWVPDAGRRAAPGAGLAPVATVRRPAGVADPPATASTALPATSVDLDLDRDADLDHRTDLERDADLDVRPTRRGRRAKAEPSRERTPWRRPLVAVGAPALLLITAFTVTRWPSAGSSPAVGDPSGSTAASSRPSGVEPVDRAVLRLAAGRAAAFRSASAAPLAAVDEPGSPALAADRRFVRRLQASGIRLLGLSFAVSPAEVVRHADGTVAVTALVTTSDHHQVGSDGSASVARADPRRVVLTLVPTPDGRRWLVRSVE
jgi:hypothetical protein